MTHDEFVTTILKVSEKFNSHLVEFVQGADEYFGGVTRVEVGGTHVGWPYAFDGSSTESRARSGVLGSSEKSSSNASRWNSWHVRLYPRRTGDGSVRLRGVQSAQVSFFESLLQDKCWKYCLLKVILTLFIERAGGSGSSMQTDGGPARSLWQTRRRPTGPSP